MVKLFFDDWIRSEKIEKEFKEDFKRISRTKKDGFLSFIFLILMILIIIIVAIVEPKTGVLKNFFLFSFLTSFILMIFFIIRGGINLKVKLTPKEFVVYLLNKLGDDIKNFSKEQKIGEEDAQKKIKILKKYLDDEWEGGFNFENITKLKREIYNLAKHFELKINKDEIDNQADSIFLKSIARDIYNESTPHKIINEIIAKHKNDFEVGKIKEFRFNKKYIFIGIIFIALIFTGIYFKIVDKKDIYFIIATFFITIVFSEILKYKK